MKNPALCLLFFFSMIAASPGSIGTDIIRYNQPAVSINIPRANEPALLAALKSVAGWQIQTDASGKKTVTLACVLDNATRQALMRDIRVLATAIRAPATDSAGTDQLTLYPVTVVDLKLSQNPAISQAVLSALAPILVPAAVPPS